MFAGIVHGQPKIEFLFKSVQCLLQCQVHQLSAHKPWCILMRHNWSCPNCLKRSCRWSMQQRIKCNLPGPCLRWGTRRQLPPRYMTGENGIGVMMLLTVNELVVQSQYQNQRCCHQTRFREPKVWRMRLAAGFRPDPLKELERSPYILAAIWEGSYF